MLDEDKVVMVVSTTCLEVPPEHYGGVEQMVYNLCYGLGQRGYDVTCVAPQGTEIPNVDIIETVEPDDSQSCFRREPEAYEEYAPYMPDCDVVIDHSWQKLSYIGKHNNPDSMSDTEIVGAWHGMPSVLEKPPVENPNYVSVSKAAAQAWQDAVGFEVRDVKNGVDFSRYTLTEDDDGYYISLNRIMEEKGIKECIKAAEEAEVHLKVVGEDQFVDDQTYVTQVMGMCARSEYAEYVGAVGESEKLDYLQNAKGVLLLPQNPYKEVFGLAAVEAAACGTPVIAADNNGLSEVVSTYQGWGVVDNHMEAVDRIQEIEDDSSEIPSPEDLRASAKSHYSIEKMTDIYLKRAEEAITEGW